MTVTNSITTTPSSTIIHYYHVYYWLGQLVGEQLVIIFIANHALLKI